MGLVIPMSSFRLTLKKVFKHIKGLTSNMVIGPADAAKERYDLLVVDESHRLRRRVNLGAYFGAFDRANALLGLDKHSSNELHWVVKQADKTVLFYDKNQSIKPSDVKQKEFNQLIHTQSTTQLKLETQFRVKGWPCICRFR